MGIIFRVPRQLRCWGNGGGEGDAGMGEGGPGTASGGVGGSGGFGDPSNFGGVTGPAMGSLGEAGVGFGGGDAGIGIPGNVLGFGGLTAAMGNLGQAGVPAGSGGGTPSISDIFSAIAHGSKIGFSAGSLTGIGAIPGGVFGGLAGLGIGLANGIGLGGEGSGVTGDPGGEIGVNTGGDMSLATITNAAPKVDPSKIAYPTRPGPVPYSAPEWQTTNMNITPVDPYSDPRYASYKQAQEQQYANALREILASTPQGGQLLDQLARASLEKAANLTGYTGQLTQDMADKQQQMRLAGLQSDTSRYNANLAGALSKYGTDLASQNQLYGTDASAWAAQYGGQVSRQNMKDYASAQSDAAETALWGSLFESMADWWG